MAWKTYTPEELAESRRIMEEFRRQQALPREQRRQLAEHQKAAAENREHSNPVAMAARSSRHTWTVAVTGATPARRASAMPG
jgi:hypothetical protein